jgi:hypothetical protein
MTWKSSVAVIRPSREGHIGGTETVCLYANVTHPPNHCGSGDDGDVGPGVSAVPKAVEGCHHVCAFVGNFVQRFVRFAVSGASQ